LGSSGCRPRQDISFDGEQNDGREDPKIPITQIGTYISKECSLIELGAAPSGVALEHGFRRDVESR
jgi:hypothetical protein